MAVDIQTIGFGADVSGLKTAQSELDKTGRAAVKTADGADRLGAKFSALSSVTSLLKGMLAGIGFAALGKQFIEVADAVSLMEARLKLATGNMADFAAAQTEIYRISQAAQVGLAETATLYTRLADPVRRLGGGVRETAAMVEAFALTLRISGASSAEASAATLQFSQAMAAGALRGDEFNSIAETSPRLLKAVAESLGVNAGALREMAKDGELSADVIGNALIGSLKDLQAESQQLPNTVGGVMTQLSNMTTVLVGEFDKASGASGGMAGILTTVLVPALKVAYTAVAGVYAALQSVAHIWVGVLSAVTLAAQGEFKLALTMFKQIPIDIGKTVASTTESINRVWAMSVDGATAATGTIRTLNGALGGTGDAAKGAAKELKQLLDRERQMRELIDKASLADFQREENEALQERIRLAELNNALFDDEFERRERARTGLEGGIKSAREMVDAIRFETEMLGLSNTEREIAISLRQLETQGLEKGSEAYAVMAGRIREVIEARAAARGKTESAKQFEADWQRSIDQIGQSFSDALMGGGKSAWEYIKGLFRTGLMVPIKAFMNGMMGSFGAVVGGGSAPGGSSLSSMGSIASTLGSIGTFGSSFGTSMATAFSGPGLAATLGEAGALLSSGGTAAGLGMGLGAVAPYAMAAIALYQLLSSGGEKRAGSTYGYSASDLQYGQGLKGIWSDDVAGMISGGSTRFIGGPSGGEIGGDTIRASVAATVEGINGLFDRLGSTDKIDQFWGKLEQSEKGRGGVFSGGTLASGASFGEAGWEAGTSRTLTTDEAIAAFALDLQQATIQALQAAADIPAVISDMLADVDAESLTQEQASGLLQTVEAIVAVTAALGTLGVQAAGVTTAMIEAAGGADALGAAAASYYQGYYSEGERVGALAEQLAGQIGALGLEMPGTRDEFRALVESLDLTTAQGQSAYGTLLTLSDAFGVVADSAAAAADESLRAAQESARAALDAQSAAIEDEIAAMVRAFGDLEGAMSALDAPAENLVEQWQSASQQLADMTRELDRILGTGEAGPFDALAQTVASLASASRGIEAIDQMRFGVATSAASDQSVELMAQRERELFAELRTAADPAAVAQELAQVALARIKMAGDLSGQALAEEYREQYESARAVLDLQRESRDEQISALREQISAAEQMRRIIGGMRGVIDDLLVGDLSALGPEGRLGAARQSYDRTLAGARAGDVSAMSGYADALRTYLGQSQSYYGGATSEYASAFAAALAEAEEMAGAQVSDVELLSSQLETLQSMDIEQAEMRQTVIDTSAEQLAALDSIGAALRERESALQQRQDEQASAARQQVDLLSAIVEGQEAEIRQRAAAMQALQEQLAKLQDQIGRIQSSVESIEVAA